MVQIIACGQKKKTLPASQVALVAKNLPASAEDTRDTGLIPELGRSPGEGNGNPLQCSCLEIPWTKQAGRLSPWGRKELDLTAHTNTPHPSKQ